MGIVGIIVGVLFGLAIPILIVAGIVYFILRIKSGITITVSFRFALRVYFYVAILVSIGLAGLGGLSTLINVGFGEIVDREFSYGDVYEEHREIQNRLKNDNYIYENGDTERSLPDKVELEMKSSLINGISLTMIGIFLLVVHFFGRIWVETKDERSDVLRRVYLIIGLAIFAIVTVISLAAGVPETLRYALLEVSPGEASPGETLALSIVALPIWVCYLVATLRNVRLANAVL
jgi:uncharacterized membrane protein YeiB